MNSILGNTRKPDITFHHNGRIDITARTGKLLNLQAGDVIDITKVDIEYLIYVRHRNPIGQHHATAHPSKSNYNNFRVWSKPLAQAILKLSGQNRTAKLCVGEPTILDGYGCALPIIYKHILP